MSLSTYTTTRTLETPLPISLLLSSHMLKDCPDCHEFFAKYRINIHVSPHDGKVLLKMLGEINPDFVLLDVFMPVLDALEIKKMYSRQNHLGKVIFLAAGPFYEDSIIKELIENGFAYYFMKPFHAEALSSRMRKSTGKSPWLSEPATEIQKITLMLRELGMPAHLLGFHFIRQAIGMVLNNPTRYGSGRVTLQLYPDIATQNNTTSSRVERAIRHAIDVAFDRGNPDALEEYFGDSLNNSKGKATNSEFIATVSDRLYIEGMSNNTNHGRL